MSEASCNQNKLVGANFTLAPMCDNFIDFILGTLDKVDLSHVWRETDDVSTVIRGKAIHVFNVTKAICIHAAKSGTHVGFQATFSNGCPGNEEVNAYLDVSDEVKNEVSKEDADLYAAAKFALYPIGAENFMQVILEQIEEMKNYVKVSRVPQATKLEGGLEDIFTGLEKAFQAMLDAGSHHNVMNVTISINSPSHQ